MPAMKLFLWQKGCLLWKDRAAQDMVEYALLAAAVAVAVGAILPPVAPSISTVFSKINSLVQRMP